MLTPVAGSTEMESSTVSMSEVLNGRRSVRSFSPREVVPDDIQGLMEAARWSPSGGNRQPWRYILRVAGPARAALGACLNRGNQWALAAPLLITQVTRLADAGQSNGVPYAFFDSGLSVMCLIVEAETRGLRAHPMAGWNGEALMAELGIPSGYQPTVVMAVGHEGDPEALDPATREKEAKPRVRRPLTSILAYDRWSEHWSESP